MGAYGDITCPTCGVNYYELDYHDCNMDDIKQHIAELEAELEHEKYMGTKCAEIGYELKADKQRLRDALISVVDATSGSRFALSDNYADALSNACDIAKAALLDRSE